MASQGRFPFRQALFALVAIGALGVTVACNSTSSTGPGVIPTAVPSTPQPSVKPSHSPNPNPTASVIIIIGSKYHRT